MGRSQMAGGCPRLTSLMGPALVCSFLVAVSPCPGSAQVERWTLERTVTVGDALDPETGLTLVEDVIVQGDRLLVAQPLERRLRVFSLAGRNRQAWERAFGTLEFFPPVGDVQAGTDGTTWLLVRTGRGFVRVAGAGRIRPDGMADGSPGSRRASNGCRPAAAVHHRTCRIDRGWLAVPRLDTLGVGDNRRKAHPPGRPGGMSAVLSTDCRPARLPAGPACTKPPASVFFVRKSPTPGQPGPPRPKEPPCPSENEPSGASPFTMSTGS